MFAQITIFQWVWYIILPYIAVLLPMFFGVAFWFYRNRHLPEAARILNRAKQEGKPVAIIAHDSGRAALTLWSERRAGGVVMDEEGFLFKILPRYVGKTHLTEYVEEKIDVASPDGSIAKVPVQKEKQGEEVIALYSDYVTKKNTLIGLGLPFYVGYSGSLCLLNPECLAMVEAGEMYIETEDEPILSAKGREKIKQLIDEGKDWHKELIKPLLLLDLKKIRAVLRKVFDESQINACLAIAERVGQLGRPSKWRKFLPIILILFLAVIAGVAMLVLPSFFG